MNQEQFIQRGNLAEALLTQETFQLAANELTQYYIQETFGTDPKEIQKREGYYFQAKGLHDMIGLLNQWVATRDQIIRNQADDEESSGIED